MTLFRVGRVLGAALAGASLVVSSGSSLRAAGTITGVVFEDFNGNGRQDLTTTVANSGAAGTVSLAVDRGVPGVTVTAYDAAGVAQGTTVTGANGAYSLSAAGTGRYRIEFTDLPVGYRPSAMANGVTGNGTTVQFVEDGVTANVNLGILDGASFCQNNPTLVTSCFVFGAASGAFGANPSVVDFPYAAGSNSAPAASYNQPSTHALAVAVSQVGAVYGLGYRPATNTLYAGAFMKKHSGFGAGGPGAIYAIDATSGATTLFADLDAIFGAGTAGADPHDPADYDRDNGNASWDAVGKRALGGLEVSPDGAFLYVMNLADRQVYRLPTSGVLDVSTVQRVPVPLNAPGATGLGGADLRPFALQFFRGRLYVGMVNSAESAGATTADLRAYVYTLDPATLVFSAAPVFQFALDYPRGVLQTFNGTGPGEWNRWVTGFATESPSGVGTYPQPMLTGLTFDVNGNMTLGLRDRAGDQFGFFALDDPGSATTWEGVAGGDTLFAAITTPGDLNSGWTLESNAQAGAFGPTAGANNGEGPGPGPGPLTGFGEYYFADAFFGTHRELSGGAVLQLPGYPDVVSSAFDPGLTVRTGGFIWLSGTAGSRTKGYNLYDTGFAPAPQPTFSKANGFGELVPICQAAPIEIGNRVWDDLDGDGVQDPNEAGLDGVAVQLIAPGGAVLATATTANGGQYYFSSAAGTSTTEAVYGVAGLTASTAGFRLRIDPAQGSLGGRSATVADADATANGDSRDSDGVLTVGNVEVGFATGPAGANDHTYDFGFTTTPPVNLSLGNLVWADTNNNGIVDGAETGIAGVTVRLIAADGVTVLQTTTTNGSGLYLFSGLAAGTYYVEVVPPPGATSSTDIASSATPNNDVNNDDNGVTVIGGAVRSGPVTLGVGTEPTNDGDTNADSNLSVDFGFVPSGTLSLGNLVWLDVNNNGLVDSGEPGLAGVTVRLIAANGSTVLGTTTTDGSGNYLFSSLPAGTYIVEVDRTSSAVTGYLSSTDIASSATPDNDVNNDDNGIAVTPTAVRSAPVTLSALAEPVTDGDSDPNSNLSVDFGFVRALSLGNLVWADVNNNGLVDPGETGIGGVTVRLIAADGVTVLQTTTTDASGRYLFGGLPPGTYYVEVVPPSGSQSSTDIGSSGTPNNDVDNDDNGVTLIGGAVRSGPITLGVGTEPTNDGDANPDSNLTVDFGFVPPLGGGLLTDICLQQVVPATVAPGGQMTVTYTTTNRGPGTATDVVIDGMLPPGVSVVSTTTSPGGVCTVTAGMLDCRWLGSTPAGPAGVRQVTVVFQVAANVPPGTPLALWFMTSASNPDPYPACNMVDAYVFVSGGPVAPVDLVVSGAVSAAGAAGTTVAAAVNQPVAGRFTVTNTGAAPARGRYAIQLDEAGVLEVASATWSQGWAGVSTATAGVWETELIAPGASATLNLTLVPRAGTAAKVQAIRIDGAPADPNAANDHAEFVVDAVGAGGGRFVAVGNVDGAAGGEIVTGNGQGETPQLQVFSGAGTPLADVYAFDRTFLGGVRVASCDVNGDGRDEVIAAQGPGGGRVRVLSLAGGVVSEVVAFDAFESGFTGGVNVACADLDLDGRGDVVVGPDGGRAPDVKVFTVGALSAVVTAQFQAYEAAFTGGVRVAASRFGGSAVVGAFNIATMPGPGRAMDVRTWQVNGATATLGLSVTLSAATTGARVVLGDINNDATLDLVVTPDGGAPALLQAFSLANGAVVLNAPMGAGGFRSLHAAVGVLGGGPGVPELVVGSGPGQAPTVLTVIIGSAGAVVPRVGLTAFEKP